jgi:hypothetical protein
MEELLLAVHVIALYRCHLEVEDVLIHVDAVSWHAPAYCESARSRSETVLSDIRYRKAHTGARPCLSIFLGLLEATGTPLLLSVESRTGSGVSAPTQQQPLTKTSLV